jgi:hypothetical protein
VVDMKRQFRNVPPPPEPLTISKGGLPHPMFCMVGLISWLAFLALAVRTLMETAGW